MRSEHHEVECSLRRRNRVAAVQFLYMYYQRKEKTFSPELFSNFCQMLSYPIKDFFFAQTLIQGILEHLPFIDECIEQHIRHWKLSRVAMVDLCILRVAVHELFFDETVPPIVVIDEAVEIGKALSSPESKSFINGILDQIKNLLHRPLRTPTPDKLISRIVPSYGTVV
jgi:N utilization substance protein B